MPQQAPANSTVQNSYVARLNPDRQALMAGYRTVHAARKVVGVGSVGTAAGSR